MRGPSPSVCHSRSWDVASPGFGLGLGPTPLALLRLLLAEGRSWDFSASVAAGARPTTVTVCRCEGPCSNPPLPFTTKPVLWNLPGTSPCLHLFT